MCRVFAHGASPVSLYALGLHVMCFPGSEYIDLEEPIIRFFFMHFRDPTHTDPPRRGSLSEAREGPKPSL